DTVLLDNVRAGRMAVEHLLAPGHRDIVCLAGPSGVSTTEDRLRGALDALDEAGISHDDRRMLRSDLRSEDAEAMVSELVGGTRRPDAIFATNGPVTVGAYQAIQRSRLRMPEEISLVGVDDDRWTQM